MTPTKILLAGAAMVSLLIMFATRPTAPMLPAEKDQGQVNSIRTLSLAQMPFDTPAFVPDEETKKRALLRAYELNGNSMVREGSIDLSNDPVVHPELKKTEALPMDVVDPNTRNALDAQAEDKPDWDARRRFMNRTFRATRDQLARHDENKPKDVCTRHGLHKVVYRGSWRCRK